MATPNKKFRVLVVDDSSFMRKVLEGIFSGDDQLQVVGNAKDGREAVAMAESLKPDVITMDINMPHVDGLQATAEIMTTNPKPIVIVSSESREGAASTLRALELGAIEFVAKPSSAIDLDMQSVKEELLRKVRMAAKVRVVRTAARLALTIQNANGSKTPAPASVRVRPSPMSGLDQRFPVVVLAASTGGPATVMRIAPGFTGDFPAAVILVQHMPAAFTTQYATQLAEFTGIRVKEAEANESLQPGTPYICPGGQHLRITPTDVECSRLKRLIGFRLFHADSSEFGELRGVLRRECRGHVLHQNYRGREVSGETRRDAHAGRWPPCRRCQHAYREALVEPGHRRGTDAHRGWCRSLGSIGILNCQGQA